MELISRAFLNTIINNQTGEEHTYDKEDIKRLYGLKPYKREGKTWLYYVKEVNECGISYKRELEGYYPIPKFEDKYWINKEGTIINVNNEKVCHSAKGVDGYEHVTLRYYGKKYRKRVHSLMGKVFLGNPQVVNHKDGNKSSNNLSNLERATHSSNIKHAYDNDFYSSRGGKGTTVIVTSRETGISVELNSMREAERKTGVDRHKIRAIILGKVNNYTKWNFKYK